MKRSASEIFAVALAIAAAAPLFSKVLSDNTVKSGGGGGALARARDSTSSPFSFDWGQWKSLLWKVYTAIGADKLGLLAAGVAFYALFAIFPGLGAAIWLFGLFADPGSIQQQLNNVRDVLPAEAFDLIQKQLVALTSKQSAGFSITGIISLLVALYSARLAASSMMEALNAVYKVDETRGFVEANAIAVLFTLACVSFGMFLKSARRAGTLLQTGE